MKRYLPARALLALVCAGSAFWAVHAATPASQNVTVPTTDGQVVTVTWTGTLSPGSNPGSDCLVTANPTGDSETIALSVPAGTYTNNSVTAVFQIDWADGSQDGILTLFQDGTDQDASDGGNPHEEVTVNNPAAGSYVAMACPFTVTAATPYTGKLTLTNHVNGGGSGPPPPPPPPPPHAQPDATLNTTDVIGYENFEAPGVLTTTVQSNGNTVEYLGRGAGEPSTGVNWKTATPAHPGGVTNFQSDLQTLFVTFDDTCPANGKKATWANRPAPTSQAVDSDPIGFTNRTNGRTFAGELTLLSPTCKIAYTDDDGANWVATTGPGGSGVDHQTIGGGPYHVIPPGIPPPYAVPTADGSAPQAFYYCSQDIAAAYCLRSDDGGVSWQQGTQMYTLTSCGGLHGHVKVSPASGTVYVPNNNCSGIGAVAVSIDNGTTWTVRQVKIGTLTTSGSNSDPAVAIDAAGKVYFFDATQNGANNSFLTVATSTDDGVTWQNLADVTSQLGIMNVRYPAAVAGDAGRAAVGFYGSKTAGDADGQNAYWGAWHLYIAHTFDGGLTWSVSDATPNLPMQRGCIWTGGGGDICRNLLDFFDLSMDKEGRVTAGYVNGCPGGSCSQMPDGAHGNDYSATATIARQSSGRRLLAAADGLPSTSMPGIPSVTARRIGTITHLAWSEGDTGNSPITGYEIWRGTASGAETLLTTVPGNQSTFDDAGTTDVTASYYYYVVAVNAIGSSCKNNEIKVDYMGDTCPGVVIHQNDPAHPESTAAQSPTNTNLAIDYISVAEPITDLIRANGTVDAAGGTYLKFTMKVGDLALVPPSSRWRIVWDSYDSPGQLFYVGMRNDSSSTTTFDYGSVGDAGLPAVLVLSETKTADAFPESNYNADGTITVYVPKSGVGNPSATWLLGAMGGKTFSGDTSGTQNYQRSTALIDHTFVKGVTDNSFPAAAYLMRDTAHVTDNHAPTETLVNAGPTYGNPTLTTSFTVSQLDVDGDAPGSYRFRFGDGANDGSDDVVISCGNAPSAFLHATCNTTSHDYQTPGYYTATIWALDSCGMKSAPVTVQVHVNGPPVANAGTDFSVNEGAGALLSGSQSTDPDNDVLSYSWAQTAGPTVTLVNANTATPSFTAPQVSANTPLTFRLTVTDQPLGLTSTDDITVTVLQVNAPPVANAGPDQTVDEGTLATLADAGSSDPDGDVLTYTWSQVSGPSVTIGTANAPVTTFTAPDVTGDTPLTFQLKVTDGHGGSATDQVIVTVHDLNPPIGDNSVGALPPLSLLVLLLPAALRSRRRASHPGRS